MVVDSVTTQKRDSSSMGIRSRYRYDKLREEL